jgi:hypothetical protein
MNFIFVSLCDNDFGHTLAEATKYVYDNQEVALTEQEFKHFVVNYVAWKHSIQWINPTRARGTDDVIRVKNYLDERVKITFTNEIPTVDHDGGSAVLDTNTGYVWQI